MKDIAPIKRYRQHCARHSHLVTRWERRKDR